MTGWSAWILAGAFAVLAPGLRAQTRLTGQVLDENGAPVAEARIVLTRSGPEAPAWTIGTLSGPTGAFVFEPAEAGEYSVSASREGYFALKGREIRLIEGANEITLVLNKAREVFESVDVVASPPGIDLSRTTPERTLDAAEVALQPYPNTHSLRNATRLMPSVVQDSRGGLHITGGSEEQTLFTLDGFNIGDPLTGRFESRLAVESVSSMEVSSGAYPAEFGKGSAGVLAVRTSTGDDKFRYSATNFVPGLEYRKGARLNSWTPRFQFSGPIQKGRVWFSDTMGLEYNQNLVEALPKGQDTAPSWRTSNLLRSQVNLTSSNLLYTGFLFNSWNAERAGLSVLDPPETTREMHSRQYFAYVKDQIYSARGAVFEFGYAANRTLLRELPQGVGMYVLTPEGNRGFYYVNSRLEAARDQWMASAILPSFEWFGAHQLKTGIDIDRLGYWQDISRTGYETYRADGSLSNRVTFAGSGLLSKSNVEIASYVQDSWRVRPGVQVEAGVRQDWDRILSNIVLSPRLGFAWAPAGLKETKIFGGFAVAHDATNLRMFTRPLDQYSLTTTFNRDGTVEQGPSITAFLFPEGRLRTPYYNTWTLGVERRLAGGLFGRFVLVRKRGGDGLTYVYSPDSWAQLSEAVGSAFRLSNMRLDRYDSFEVTVRKTYRGANEWLASYVRSRARSNAVADVSADAPIFVTDNTGPMPWDTPNRLLSWGTFPIWRKNWSAVYLAEWRDGFPFSVYGDTAQTVGGVNSRRFPAFFELNLHIERRLHFRGRWWGFRFGFNNITNHKNPNVVNGNMDSPHFMTFYGGQGRAFVIRLRLLAEK